MLRGILITAMLFSMAACSEQVEVTDLGKLEKPAEHEQWATEAKEESKPKPAERKVVVPDGVYNHFPSLTLSITAPGGTSREFEIAPESEVEVDGFSIRAGAFLPSFVIQADIITSETLMPTNPALMLDIAHQGEPVFTGWLFAEYPELTMPQKEGYTFHLLLPENKQES